MSNQVFQCCYTNATSDAGGQLSSGWQPVAVSSGMPSDALNACVSLQGANSTIQGAMTDERGHVLDLFEVAGDDSYVYVMRSKYGMLDRLGRANMFSHAYVFPWKDTGALTDPNVFLGVSNKSFASSEQDALAKAGPTWEYEFDLDDTLQELDIDPNEYLTLIQCVYAQMSERTINGPLYVGYDGGDRQLRAILFCIYLGLPYYLRRRLTIASTETSNTNGKSLIFSERASEHDHYVIPGTGENNVITKRLERKICRVGYADYAVRNYGAVDADAYFDELESTAIELGDSAASNPLTLKIAHLLITNPDVTTYADAELDEYISDALRARSAGSARMEHHVAVLLGEVTDRGLALTEETDANLGEKVEAAESEELREAGERYSAACLARLPKQDAARRLMRMGGTLYDRLSRHLAQSAEGLEILDLYYLARMPAGESVSWESLHGVLDASAFMGEGRPKTLDAVERLARQLYVAGLDEGGSVVEDFDSYLKLMARLVPADALATCEREAREDYWSRVTFDTFDLGAAEAYAHLKGDVPRAEMFCDLFELDDLLRRGDDEGFLRQAYRYFVTYDEELGAGEWADALPAVEGLVTDECGNEATSLIRWTRLVVDLPSGKNVDRMLSLRRELHEANFDAVVGDCRRMQGAFERQNMVPLAERLGETVLAECLDIDAGQTVVPLDVWIGVRGARRGNAFGIFDRVKPSVLDLDPAAVAGASFLMTQPNTLAEADRYVRSRGSEQKVVKAWMREARRTLRGDEGTGGPAGALLGLFGRGGRDDVAYEQRAHEGDDGRLAYQGHNGGHNAKPDPQAGKRLPFGFGRRR